MTWYTYVKLYWWCLFFIHEIFLETLKLTFLREAIIPPPMCGWEIEFPSIIHSIDLTTTNTLSVITHDGDVHCFQLACNGKDSEEKGFKILRREGRRYQPSWISSYSFDFSGYSNLCQIKWVNSTTFIACQYNQLLVFQINENQDLPGKITVRYTCKYIHVQAIHKKMN